MATHSDIPAWKIPWGGGAWYAIVHGIAELEATEQLYWFPGWRDFPNGPVAKNSTLPMQRAWVQSPVRELDPTRCSLTSQVLQLTPRPTE